MAISATTLALIGAGIAAAGATGGAIGSAANRKKARNEKNAWYDYADSFARSQAQSSIFDTPGGKALLKLTGRDYDDNLDAIQNRAVAGGATMENMLAARQANNENRDKVHMQMLQSDEKRREGWNQQLLNLKGQRANDTANSYMQAAQDWQQWGGQMAQAGMSLMSSGLLGSAGGAVAGSGAADAVQTGAGSGYQYAPLAPARSNNLGGLMNV